MKYLIVGRTASGKDHFARYLSDKMNMAQLKSYSTRPKRSENEDTHIFITPDEACTYRDKVATTEINGYEYFATRDQVESSDIYIIDPFGLDELTAKMPDTPFMVIYISALYDDRKLRSVSRITKGGCDAESAIRTFEEREQSETNQFDAFERKITSGVSLASNIVGVITINNDFGQGFDGKAADVAKYMRLQNRLEHLVRVGNDRGIFNVDGSIAGIIAKLLNDPDEFQDVFCSILAGVNDEITI